MSPLVVMFAWALWHDLSVYRAAEFLPLAGPTYQVTSYDTTAECEAEQVAAMAKEELPRAGPSTERLLDGIRVWDPDRRHSTTSPYFRCPPGAGPPPSP